MTLVLSSYLPHLIVLLYSLDWKLAFPHSYLGHVIAVMCTVDIVFSLPVTSLYYFSLYRSRFEKENPEVV